MRIGDGRRGSRRRRDCRRRMSSRAARRGSSLALAAGLDPAIVLGYPERPLDADGAAALRRPGRAPRARASRVSRLAGRREFWSLDFALSPDTLDPRPDSETLIAAALAAHPDRAAPLRMSRFRHRHRLPAAGAAQRSCRTRSASASTSVPGAVRTARAERRGTWVGSTGFFRCRRLGRGDRRRGSTSCSPTRPIYRRATIAALAPEVAALRATRRARWRRRRARRLSRPRAGTCRACSRRAALPRRGGRRAGRAGSGGYLRPHGLEVQAVHRDLAGIERCLVVASASLRATLKKCWNRDTSRLG